MSSLSYNIERPFDMRIIVFDHSYHEVVSGGSVIAAEFAKAWGNQGHDVTLSTHDEAAHFFRSRGINPHVIHVASRIRTRFQSVLVGSIAHLINGTLDSIFTPPPSNVDVVFAASWSLQDLIPAIIFTCKRPRAKLVVGCYIFLTPPWVPSYGSNGFNRMAFWTEYCLGISLTYLFATIIWTASPVDAKTLRRIGKNAFAIRGGVDTHAAAQAKHKAKRNDAVYIGRFHPQKNILELVGIWKLVTETMPHATLVIAGAGFLKTQLATLIQKNNLKNNITLLPPVDGAEKFTLLTRSKLFVSASHYDTGNLALDEALVCGTPGVIYDLPKVVYPRGVESVRLFDIHRFADTICALLTDEKRFAKLGRQATQFGKTLDWNTQANRALDSLKTISTQ